MARSDPQLNFRCPADLKDRLEAAASASGRSLTQEIVARLQESLDANPRTLSAADELRAVAEELKEHLRTMAAGVPAKPPRKRKPG